MRTDRTVSLVVSAMRPRYGGQCTTILMYHSISDRTETPRHPYFGTVTSPARFAQQMQWLAESGARVIPLDEWMSFSGENHTHRVVITFDDGFADFETGAFPVLRAYGFSSAVFLPTAFIGTGTELLPGVRHLGWNDIGNLHSMGVRFGSHTVNHRHLSALSTDEIAFEIRESARTIHERLGCAVTDFSCPFAFPQAHPVVVEALRESLAESGYRVGVTTRIGTASYGDDPYTLKRIPVNGFDDQRLFLAKLNGGYDWVAGLQRMMRIVKKVLRR